MWPSIWAIVLCNFCTSCSASCMPFRCSSISRLRCSNAWACCSQWPACCAYMFFSSIARSFSPTASFARPSISRASAWLLTEELVTSASCSWSSCSRLCHWATTASKSCRSAPEFAATSEELCWAATRSWERPSILARCSLSAWRASSALASMADTLPCRLAMVATKSLEPCSWIWSASSRSACCCWISACCCRSWSSFCSISACRRWISDCRRWISSACRCLSACKSPCCSSLRRCSACAAASLVRWMRWSASSSCSALISSCSPTSVCAASFWTRPSFSSAAHRACRAACSSATSQAGAALACPTAASSPPFTDLAVPMEQGVHWS
mmetsp:Transcript_54588/g.119010  ORF Transcript_54588/g.119010 Transcript_54588/m.119010 type:complete len:328 (+) Transcript_54588:1374-2357(+)